jgi:sugar phosphate isomerase/epimerase
MKLSLAAYSFRDYLKGPKKSMTLEDFIDLCAENNLDGTELTSYYFPDPVTPEYCHQLRKRAFLLGLTVSGTPVGNTFTYPPGSQLEKQIDDVKKWVDHAAELGAPVIRIFAGNLQKGTTEEQARHWCIEAIERACEYAGKKGVVLALENHGGIVSTADQVLSIVTAVKSEWFGVNWDSGNFRGPDPYKELAKIAPYAVTVQLKTEVAPNGKKQEADLEVVIGILRSAGYRGFVALEYEAKEDPKTAVPRYLRKIRSLIQS